MKLQRDDKPGILRAGTPERIRQLERARWGRIEATGRVGVPVKDVHLWFQDLSHCAPCATHGAQAVPLVTKR